MDDSDPHLRTLGPYRLESLLGHGGMGEVWLAHDRRLDRRVAIKHLRAERTHDEASRTRFRREAWAAARIAHPSVVPIFDVVEDQAGDWIVMEFVDGPSLRDLVAEEPLGLGEALRYGRQIAEGLAAAHREGLVHRDLKTENVMIAPPGHAKILDFGLAKKLVRPQGDPGGQDLGSPDEDSLTVRGQIMGTVRAMSPEQARGLDVDASSDLFSLGTLLYEITTGVSPFLGQNALDTMSRVVSYQPPPAAELRRDLPAELSALIERLLDKAPEHRPSSAFEVASALQALEALEALSHERVTSASLANHSAWQAETLTGDGKAFPNRALAASEAAASEAQEPRFSARRKWQLRGAAGLATLAAVLLITWLASRNGCASRNGWLASRNGQMPATVESGTEAKREDAAPTSFDILQRAQRQLELGEDPEKLLSAFEALSQLIADEPKNAAAHAALADAYLRKFLTEADRGWLDKAIGLAREAVRLDDYLAAAHISLGAALSLHGDAEAARAALKTALVLDPGNARAWLEMADLERRAGRQDAALEILNKVIASGNATAEHFDVLGTILFERGEYQKAIEAFRHSIELAPQKVIGRRNLAGALYLNGDIAGAAEEIQHALEIRPDYGLYSNLGTLLFAQGLYRQAANTFDKALSSGGSHLPLLWINLGDAHRFIPGNEDKARVAFTRAAQLLRETLAAQPQDPRSRSRLALVLAKLGNAKEARLELAKVAATGDTKIDATVLATIDASTLYRMAVAFELLGSRDAALDFLQRALSAGYSKGEVASNPELGELRLDPRYHRILAAGAG